MKRLAFALLLLTAWTASPVLAEQTVSPQKRADATEAGRHIYYSRCSHCHGYAGDAHTVASTYLDPKPRNFSASSPAQLSREHMLDAISHGRPGTAMQPFSGILNPAEIAAVADYVRSEFMRGRSGGARYHTPANGWNDHERHAIAFPFASGEMTLDRPVAELSAEQRTGRRLFLAACVVCHDRAQAGANRELRPLSYPRNGHTPGKAFALDGMASASPYRLHDQPPRISGLGAQEKRGEALFRNNCAFCHAADGTARNWIGSFLQPHPRDFTDREFMSRMTRTRMAAAIREGLPGTSMPAWKTVLSEPDIRALVAYVSRAFHPLGD
jgi:cytochrome c oxidase cbb3-type subunit 3